MRLQHRLADAAIRRPFDLVALRIRAGADHCNGKLFIDHLPKLRRDMVVKRFKKEKNWK